MNKAAIDIYVQILCIRMLLFFLCIYLETLGHIVTPDLTCELLPDCFPKKMHHFIVS